MKTRIIGLSLLLLATLAGRLAATDHSFILAGPQARRTTLRLVHSYPFFRSNGPEQPDCLFGVYDLSVSVPRHNMLFTASIPLSVWKGWDLDESQRGLSGSLVGNTLLEARLYFPEKPRTRTHVALGVWLPTAGRINGDIERYAGLLAAWMTDPYNIHKYTEKTGSIYADFGAEYRAKSFSAAVTVGPLLVIPYDGTNLVLRYTAALGYEIRHLLLSAEIQGMFDTTSEEWNSAIEVKSVHKLGFGAQWRSGRLRPGVYYAIPLHHHLRQHLRLAGTLGVQLDYVL